MRRLLIHHYLAQQRIFEKELRLLQASIRAADERLDYLFALAQDKPLPKDILSLTSSELDKIFADDA